MQASSCLLDIPSWYSYSTSTSPHQIRKFQMTALQLYISMKVSKVDKKRKIPVLFNPFFLILFPLSPCYILLIKSTWHHSFEIHCKVGAVTLLQGSYSPWWTGSLYNPLLCSVRGCDYDGFTGPWLSDNEEAKKWRNLHTYLRWQIN